MSAAGRTEIPALVVGSCRIRRFRPEDAEDLWAILGDGAVMRYLEPPFSREKTVKFLQGNGLDTPCRIYALADETDRVIGQVIFHPWDAAAWEIGWILRRDHWGRGLATAVTEALIEECRRRGVKRCVMECRPDHTATRRIAEKCGFSRTEDVDGLACFILNL